MFDRVQFCEYVMWWNMSVQSWYKSYQNKTK